MNFTFFKKKKKHFLLLLLYIPPQPVSTHKRPYTNIYDTTKKNDITDSMPERRINIFEIKFFHLYEYKLEAFKSKPKRTSNTFFSFSLSLSHIVDVWKRATEWLQVTVTFFHKRVLFQSFFYIFFLYLRHNIFLYHQTIHTLYIVTATAATAIACQHKTEMIIIMKNYWSWMRWE